MQSMKHATMTVVSKGKTLKVSEKASFFSPARVLVKHQMNCVHRLLLAALRHVYLRLFHFKQMSVVTLSTNRTGKVNNCYNISRASSF